VRTAAVTAGWLLLSVLPVNASPVYLSFYGYQGAHVGCFTEGDASVTFDLLTTTGPEFQGSSHFFGLKSQSNTTYGCNLPDTNSPPGCSGYDITAWFEPGDVIIGHVSASGDQNASLEGNEWLGHVPTDFTAIRIEYASGPPCGADARTHVVPIVWSTGPVPTSSSTWGSVKALFREGESR
jgi:hypothetical protein